MTSLSGFYVNPLKLKVWGQPRQELGGRRLQRLPRSVRLGRSSRTMLRKREFPTSFFICFGFGVNFMKIVSPAVTVYGSYMTISYYIAVTFYGPYMTIGYCQVTPHPLPSKSMF